MNEETDLFGGVDVKDAVQALNSSEREKPKRAGKFNTASRESRTWNGKVYDSKLEMKMHEELLKHFPQEYVTVQPRFLLQPAYCLDASKDKQRALIYTADFALGSITQDESGFFTPGKNCMIIDAKGMILGSFILAAKLMEYKYRLPVLALKSVKQLKEHISIHKKSMNINTQQVEILTSGKPFKVQGYTNSSGETGDLEAEVIGRAGYVELLKASRELLASAAETTLEECPSEGDKELVKSAAEKLQSSLEKRLSTPEEESASRQSKNETLHPITPDLLMANESPDQLVVMRLRLLNPGALPSELPSKRNVTFWKSRIERRLPLGAYCHRLNLYPGKFVALQPL